jgi:hypothetical protein
MIVGLVNVTLSYPGVLVFTVTVQHEQNRVNEGWNVHNRPADNHYNANPVEGLGMETAGNYLAGIYGFGGLRWPRSSAIKEGSIPIPWNRFSIFYDSTRNWRFS